MKRLEAVFSLITPCKLFADIGTDHGHIAAFAASLAERVLASDISESCLKKAQDSITAANVEFAVGDGLSILTADPCVIAICGMGGHTIADILADYKGCAALILQPQNDAAFLRRFLNENGYEITHDITAYERVKFYDVIKAVRGKEVLSGEQLVLGKFYKDKNPLFKVRLINNRNKISSYSPTSENQSLLKIIEEALVFQEN